MTQSVTRADRDACSDRCGWSDCHEADGTCSGAESTPRPSACAPPSAESAPLCAEGAAPALKAPPDLTPVSYGLRFCQRADSVVEGFLCSEPTVVSDACRRADSGFDQFVCDDVKMQKLQKGILEQAWWAIRAIITQLLRGVRS
jgi:hypothetical protein